MAAPQPAQAALLEGARSGEQWAQVAVTATTWLLLPGLVARATAGSWPEVVAVVSVPPSAQTGLYAPFPIVLGAVMASYVLSIPYYLDAGTGSMLVQLAVAGVAGAAVFAKMGWAKITGPFRRKQQPADPGSGRGSAQQQTADD